MKHGFWLIAGLDDARASRVEIDREAGLSIDSEGSHRPSEAVHRENRGGEVMETMLSGRKSFEGF